MPFTEIRQFLVFCLIFFLSICSYVYNVFWVSHISGINPLPLCTQAFPKTAFSTVCCSSKPLGRELQNTTKLFLNCAFSPDPRQTQAGSPGDLSSINATLIYPTGASVQGLFCYGGRGSPSPSFSLMNPQTKGRLGLGHQGWDRPALPTIACKGECGQA